MALSPEYFFFYMADATGGAKGFQDGTDQMCSIRSYHCGKHGLLLDMGRLFKVEKCSQLCADSIPFQFWTVMNRELINSSKQYFVNCSCSCSIYRDRKRTPNPFFSFTRWWLLYKYY